MIKASGRFDLPFTCTDSGDVPTSPTGTPTGTLVKNGTDLGTTVTVTMTGAQGIAACTIPSDAANGDRFYIRVSAVVSGTTYVLSGPVDTIENNLDVAVSTRPSASAIRTEIDSSSTMLSSILSAIQAQTNLSSLANMFGPSVMEIPDSGSTPFLFTLLIRDGEGKLVNLDAPPTITAVNSIGTSRAAGLSSVSNPETGKYTFTYSNAYTATAEALTVEASGAVSGEKRIAVWVSAVVDYDTLLTMAAIEQLATDIKERTDNLPDNPAAVGDAMTLTSAYDAAKTAASQTSLNSLLTTALTESYPSKNGTVTVAQALYVILAHLEESIVSGTTKTIRKRDQSTTAETFTLNSATTPTTITRAT